MMGRRIRFHTSLHLIHPSFIEFFPPFGDSPHSLAPWLYETRGGVELWTVEGRESRARELETCPRALIDGAHRRAGSFEAPTSEPTLKVPRGGAQGGRPEALSGKISVRAQGTRARSVTLGLAVAPTKASSSHSGVPGGHCVSQGGQR